MSSPSVGVRSLLQYNNFKRMKDVPSVYTVAALPAPYQRFYREWMGSEDKETPVHWKPVKEKWVRNPETGEIKLQQNTPIPVEYPDQMHQCLWGGEGVVEGYIKKAKYRTPVPKFWMPTLYKTVVHSDILDKYFSVVVTERALKLIDEHCGLDNYLLKTPAYDLKSLLALKLKRKLFLSILDESESAKRTELSEKYREFLIPREDVEWYGYSVKEAQTKYDKILKEGIKPVPKKHELRQTYFQELQAGEAPQ